MQENGETSGRKSNLNVLAVIIIIILLIILILLVFYIRTRLTITPSAKGPVAVNQISLNNSYIFASPVRASTLGESIRITVFVLDDKGIGIFDKSVSLENVDKAIIVRELQSMTDETGKAVFDISSKVKGIYFIGASVEGTNLPQRVKVVFD